MRKKKQNKTKIDDAIIKQLLENVDDPKDLFGQDGLIKQLSKRFLEAALEAEMEEHLGYEKHDTSGNNSGNSRNGYTQKTLITERGPLEIETPRDRKSTFKENHKAN